MMESEREAPTQSKQLSDRQLAIGDVLAKVTEQLSGEIDVDSISDVEIEYVQRPISRFGAEALSRSQRIYKKKVLENKELGLSEFQAPVTSAEFRVIWNDSAGHPYVGFHNQTEGSLKLGPTLPIVTGETNLLLGKALESPRFLETIGRLTDVEKALFETTVHTGLEHTFIHGFELIGRQLGITAITHFDHDWQPKNLDDFLDSVGSSDLLYAPGRLYTWDAQTSLAGNGMAAGSITTRDDGRLTYSRESYAAWGPIKAATIQSVVEVALQAKAEGLSVEEAIATYSEGMSKNSPPYLRLAYEMIENGYTNVETLCPALIKTAKSSETPALRSIVPQYLDIMKRVAKSVDIKEVDSLQTVSQKSREVLEDGKVRISTVVLGTFCENCEDHVIRAFQSVGIQVATELDEENRQTRIQFIHDGDPEKIEKVTDAISSGGYTLEL